MSSFRGLAQHQEPETDSNGFLRSLHGLDFQQWNRVVGLPVKPGRGELQFPFPYQWTVFNELMKEDGSPKSRHVCWLGSRGIGKTEFCIRFLCWLATRNDDLKGSEMMVITGSRASLSYSIISRIKNLMSKANLQDSAMSYVVLNGVKIEGYPADALSGRGKPFLSAAVIDESAWFQPSENQNVLDMIQGYWPKWPMWTLLASSPSQYGDLTDQIFKQNEEDCAWRRLKTDYRYGENLIYTPADIARIRNTSSWGREMLLRFSEKIGNNFSHSDIARACSQIYDTTHTQGSETVLSLDPGWSSSPSGIVITELRNGFITVLLAEEKHRVTYEDLSDYLLDLFHKYQPVNSILIDSSQVAMIKTVKAMIGEPQDYQEQIKLYKSQHLNYALNMRCRPIYYTTENKRTMMGMLRQALEQGLLMLHAKEHELLINSMRQCTDVEGIVSDKEHLKGNNVLDALFQAVTQYEQ